MTLLYSCPVDGDAFAFHSAEPCHLAFCELVDGCGQLCAHLLEGQLADYVLGHELVLQAVVDKVFCRNRFVVRCQRGMGSVNQPFDLLYHTFFESGIQALVNLCISDFSAYQGAYVVSVFRKIARALDRMFGFVYRDLQSADEALAGVVVGVVVQRLQRGQSFFSIRQEAETGLKREK